MGRLITKKQPRSEITGRFADGTVIREGDAIPARFIPDSDKLREFEKHGELKQQVLDLMDRGETWTVKQAAEKLGVSPVFLHGLARSDTEWGDRIRQCRQVFADYLEEDLLLAKTMAPVVARLALLKGIRPELYRDNWKITVSNPRVEKYLQEIRKLGLEVPEVEEDNQITLEGNKALTVGQE